MDKPKPIYLVTRKKADPADPTSVRLVRANNPNGALRFVVEDTLEVRRPTQDELVKLAGAGTKVEDAVES